MPTNHDAVAALPSGAAADKTLLRNLVTKRLAYVLADADTVTDLVAVDPATGVAIIDILYLGRVFHYDATDATTPHDGVTCLVTNEGRRYKLAAGTEVVAYSVLDRDLATPPASPALGDAYLVAAGATGAWAGHSNQVAVYTIRGWEFITFDVGRLIYVEDIDSYYHKNAAGTWLAGFGAQTLSANSVPLSAAINFGKRIIVENQTTTAPPGSPTVGTAYIIGPSATGAWAGHDGKIAICEVAGSFVIYTPTNGWAAYDKANNAEYLFKESSWVASVGAWAFFDYHFTQSGSTSSGGSSNYNYSSGTAPTTSNYYRKDDVTITRSASRVGAVQRFRYSADLTDNSFHGVLALFRDSEANAFAWCRVTTDAVAGAEKSIEFVTTAADTTNHVYHVRQINIGANLAPSAFVRRTFTYEESP